MDHLLEVINKIKKQLISDKLPENIRIAYEEKLLRLEKAQNRSNNSEEYILFMSLLDNQIVIGALAKSKSGNEFYLPFIYTRDTEESARYKVQYHRENECNFEKYSYHWFECVYAPVNDKDICKVYECYYNSKYKIIPIKNEGFNNRD